MCQWYLSKIHFRNQTIQSRLFTQKSPSLAFVLRFFGPFFILNDFFVGFLPSVFITLFFRDAFRAFFFLIGSSILSPSSQMLKNFLKHPLQMEEYQYWFYPISHSIHRWICQYLLDRWKRHAICHCYNY